MKPALQFPTESLNTRYLGVPTDVGHSKNDTLNFFKDRLWNTIKGWIEKVLSAGSKEVLMKSMAQAIPVYLMACFRLHRGLGEHINSLIRKFWWRCKEGKRKPNWVSWSTMTKPKYCGGLCYRDVDLFDLALLARQVYRSLMEPEALSSWVLTAKYHQA